MYGPNLLEGKVKIHYFITVLNSLVLYNNYMIAIQHAGQRVGVFIDAQNLYHSAKNLHGKRVNFGNILETAVSGRQLIRALAYVITTESGDETEFLGALEQMGIELRSKDLQIFYGGSKKADWDVGLAIDAVRTAPKLDTIVLVSGDGDFVPLVEYLQHNQGCRVEVISFAKSSSSKLMEAADLFVDMGADPKKYLLYTRIKKTTAKKTSTKKTRKKPASKVTAKKETKVAIRKA